MSRFFLNICHAKYTSCLTNSDQKATIYILCKLICRDVGFPPNCHIPQSWRQNINKMFGRDTSIIFPSLVIFVRYAQNIGWNKSDSLGEYYESTGTENEGLSYFRVKTYWGVVLVLNLEHFELLVPGWQHSSADTLGLVVFDKCCWCWLVEFPSFLLFS